MNKINEMNTLFKLGQAGDSKDFIIYILEQLHKELNASVIEKNSNNSKINKPYDQYDKENTFNYFFNNFQKNCSIISDIFFGVNQTTNKLQK
jgi:ubiquitin C-terminal hydrolase